MNHWTVRDFFDGANDMRAAFTDHFAKPYENADAKEVWSLWYVPDLYTYLRTSSTRVLPEALVTRFVDALRGWCRENIGIGGITTPPTLSVYFDGCGQVLHNDARNGRFGYVYSLTPWETRTFTGGETVILREEDYWNTERVLTPGALQNFCHVVPAHFNQLLVFDDRLVHGVRHVQGQMDPLTGRVVLHGHVFNDGMHVTGALSHDEANASWEEHLPELEARLDEFEDAYEGLVSLRISLDARGRVSDTRVLVDRVLRTRPSAEPPRTIAEAIVAWAATIRFPDAKGESIIYAPFGLTSD